VLWLLRSSRLKRAVGPFIEALEDKRGMCALDSLWFNGKK